MRNRPGLEISLQEKIIAKDPVAMDLITLILKDKEARLDYIDGKGKSFYYHALCAGNKEVADQLLLLQINNERIIFGIDENQQTCFYLAAKQGYVDHLKAIVTAHTENNKIKLGHAIWLKKDNRGYSPLHIASQFHETAAVEFLLSLISKEENGINDINNTTENGNTPLHLACHDKSFPFNEILLNLLIQHNADLSMKNLKGQTPIQFISSYAIEKQVSLFAILGNKQEFFLRSYRQYAKQNHSDHTLLNCYKKLSLVRDQQIFDHAKISFNEKKSGNFAEITTPIITQTETPKFIQEGQEIDLFTDSDEEIQNEKPAYRILNEDQDTIKKIIEDTEKYLNDLRNRPVNVISHRKLVGLATLVFGLLYLALEPWLITMAVKYTELHRNAHRNNDPNDRFYFRQEMSYEAGSGTFGVIGFVIIAMGVAGTIAASGGIPGNIYKNEWSELIANMRTNLLDKLKFLETKEAQDKKSYLPIDKKLLKSFETNLSEFESEKKTVSELTDMVTRLDQILIQIQRNLLVSSKPFSLFYQQAHTSIQIDRHLSIQNETTPMLQ